MWQLIEVDVRYRVYSVEGNRQRLDGGAMFGNVPRALWSRWMAPDDQNRIPLACRAFLIHDTVEHRRILLEAGVGAFFEPKLRERYGVTDGGHVLLESLRQRGVAPEQIDAIVLSHLHFDHAGGLLTAFTADRPLDLVFPRARFIVGAEAWERAQNPSLRDRASFVPELNGLLAASGRLEYIVDLADTHPLGEHFSCVVSHGHTPGMMLTELRTEGGSAVFCGDLIPGIPWIHLPVTMGYDRFSERVVEEKTRLLPRWLEQGTRLLLTHDPTCAAAFLTRDEHGRYGARDSTLTLDGWEL